MIISSSKNPRIKQVLALRDRRDRDRTGLTRVEGYDEIRLALTGGERPVTLFYCPDLMRDRADTGLIAELRQVGVEMVEVGERVFTGMAYREGADGWLAVFPAPGRRLADLPLSEQPFILVAEAIEKPGNLGAMLRTADAAGVDAVVAADSITDWGNPNVVRASKGAVFCMNVAEACSEDVIQWLADHAITIVVTTPQATVDYTQVDFRHPVAIVMGAEHQGVSRLWLDHADVAVRIPMFGQVDSLNVSTSTAILAYEVVRQRHGL